MHCALYFGKKKIELKELFMSYYRESLSVGDKLFGQTSLVGGQASVIKQTYAFFGLSVAAAMFGGYIGANSPAVIGFFSGWLGWIAALVLLNVLPMVAMAARHNPTLGVAALIGDGFVSGLILAPILALAHRVAPDLILTAFLITGIVFLSVTGYVMTTRRTFSAPRGLMTGIFFSIIGVVLLNMFLQMTILSLIISAAIGIFGVFILIYATSQVLNNPEADSPIPGALMLFAGLFNVFVAVLRILLILASDRD